ncbi:MAG TPA: hypothetical protein VKE51_12390 [Vicinamibacterales bacterium]|nr:hypothetical protein [Vicinamibacterales bacterium]
MLKIQRTVNGDVVLTVAGRLQADNVGELSSLLADEPPGRSVALDLKDVVLVDRDTVRFLQECEGAGITLRNCPPFVRAWLERKLDQPWARRCRSIDVVRRQSIPSWWPTGTNRPQNFVKTPLEQFA